MTETGAFEKVAKKSLGKHSSTSRALDNAISGIKDSLLDAVADCKLDAVRISLRGLFKLYEKSTSSHKAARRFRDLQDAVRCIPRRTSRRKIPTNYSKNRTGSRNITPSPRKRRVINALDNARKFMQTR